MPRNNMPEYMLATGGVNAPVVGKYDDRSSRRTTNFLIAHFVVSLIVVKDALSGRVVF